MSLAHQRVQSLVPLPRDSEVSPVGETEDLDARVAVGVVGYLLPHSIRGHQTDAQRATLLHHVGAE